MPRTNRRAAFEPHTEPCPECGKPYWKDMHWKTMCWPCYRDQHPERYASAPKRIVSDSALETENAFLRHQVRELMLIVQLMKTKLDAQPKPVFDADMLRRLRYLCHPDKHNNSEASQLAFKYLDKINDPDREAD